MEKIAFVLISTWAIVVYVFLKMISMYKRKPRPQKTVIKCPVHYKPMKDFELFHGYCAVCPADRRLVCKAVIKVENENRSVQG